MSGAMATSAIEAAIAAGADERGYFVWSLLDSFEMDIRLFATFGLVHVDFATQRRIPKASARWYADLIAAKRRSPVPAASGKPQDVTAAEG